MGDKERDLIVKIPETCHLWKAKNLTAEDMQFETVEVYEDTSHYGKALLRCKECGQLYYYDFYEYVDFEKGDDKIYTTYIPVNYTKEAIKILMGKMPIELLMFSPQIRWDDKEPRWDWKWDKRRQNG